MVNTKHEGVRRNTDIRREIAGAGLCLWQVAECGGMRDYEFSRWLRHELCEEDKAVVRFWLELAKERFSGEGSTKK